VATVRPPGRAWARDAIPTLACVALPLAALAVLLALTRAAPRAPVVWAFDQAHPCRAEVVPLDPCREGPAHGSPQHWCAPASIADEAWQLRFLVRPRPARAAADCAYDVRVFDNRKRLRFARPDLAQLLAQPLAPGLRCAADDAAGLRCEVPARPWTSVGVAVLVDRPSTALVAEVVVLNPYRPDALNVRRSTLDAWTIQMLVCAGVALLAVVWFGRALARDRRRGRSEWIVAVALGTAGVVLSGLWSEWMPVDAGGFDEHRPWRFLWKIWLWLPAGALLTGFVLAVRQWYGQGERTAARRVAILAGCAALIAVVGPVFQVLTSAWKVPGQHGMIGPRYAYYAAYSISVALPLIAGSHDVAGVRCHAGRAAVLHAAQAIGNVVVVLAIVWAISDVAFPRDASGWAGFAKPMTMLGSVSLAIPTVFGVALAIAWRTPAWLVESERLMKEEDGLTQFAGRRRLLGHLLRSGDAVLRVPPGRRLALAQRVPAWIRETRARRLDVEQLARAVGEPPEVVLARMTRLAEALEPGPSPRRRG
jgi:hypothetical protein